MHSVGSKHGVASYIPMNTFVAAGANGGTGAVCGPAPGLQRNPSTSFAADCLGFSKHAIKGSDVAAASCAPAGPAGPSACCPGSGCVPGPPACGPPTAYELGGSLFNVETSPSAPSLTVEGRLVRVEGVYGIGAGYISATGAATGFLAWLGVEGVGASTQSVGGGTAGAALPTVLLQCDLPGHTQIATLLHPRALAVRPGQVTIVGSGSVTDAITGVVVASNQPMMALVPVAGCALGTPAILVGNGDPTFATYGSLYFDLAANPCDGGATWYVCGTGFLSGSSPPIQTAFVALVDGTTGTALQLTALDPTHTLFPASTGVSLTVSGCLINVAVNDYSGAEGTSPALIWSLAPSTLTPLAPWPTPTLTQYNSHTTLRVVPPVQVQTLEAVRLRQDAAGRAFLVCRGAVGAASMSGLGLPAHCLVVMFFAADTTPDTSMGSLAWGVPDGGLTALTVPMDAVLLSDGNLVVVGNSFQGGGTWTVTYNSTLLQPVITNVDLGPTAAGGPWCIAVPTRCPRMCRLPAPDYAGIVQPAVQVLFASLNGCADLRLANAVSVANPKCIQVFGDVDWHIASPAQPGGVLNAVVVLGCQPYVQNSGAVACCSGSPWGTACPTDGGPLRVDYCCGGASTLAVAGPVVLGFTDSAPLPVVPGTLWYNGTIGRFQAYDNSGNVQTLAWATT